MSDKKGKKKAAPTKSAQPKAGLKAMLKSVFKGKEKASAKQVAAPRASAKAQVKKSTPSSKKPMPAVSAKDSKKLKTNVQVSAKSANSVSTKTTTEKGKAKSNKMQTQTSTSKLKSAISTSFLSKRAAHAEQNTSGMGVCREVACELVSTTGGYCRMHYIKNWKKIKRKEGILREKKLNHYIEELVMKYPDKYIEAIRQDLASEKDFAKVIADLEIDEGMDEFEAVETESPEGIIDSIKRDFEDDGDF